jgi:hypothetical protein
MNAITLTTSLTTVFDELVEGASPQSAYMLNQGDPGLLRSLERLTANDASSASQGGATIAAHVDHIRYGLSLMNRWAAGDKPFDDADWSTSWRRSSVTDAEWSALRSGLADEARHWRAALGRDRALESGELNVVLASIAHLAYHLGAIRQIAKGARGPKESE